MKGLLIITLGLAAAAGAFGAVIDIGTGIGNAPWQVFDPSLGFVPATSLSTAQQNGAWAPPPTGSDWVSFGSNQGTSCSVGQTPGNGCASTLLNPAGDTWQYVLNISAAQLGATSGTVNFVFGAQDVSSRFGGLMHLTIGLHPGPMSIRMHSPNPPLRRGPGAYALTE